jgi:hypothetical protein
MAQKDNAETIMTPVTYRLPLKGQDPYFGFSRSYYYEGEKRGYWRLIHARDKGKPKGVTLVPYKQVAAHVNRLIAARSKQTRATVNQHAVPWLKGKGGRPRKAARR